MIGADPRLLDTGVQGSGRGQMPPRLLHVMTLPMSLTFLRGQVAFMKARGLELAVASAPGDALDRFARQEQVPAFAVPMERRISPLRDVRALATLVRAIRAWKPAIVHAHTPKGGLLGMLAATIARTPVRVYHVRGLPFITAAGARRRLLRGTERVSCRLAQRVFCVSPSLREVALAERICPAAKIAVLGGGSGNGVDAQGRFDPGRLPPGTRDRVRRERGLPADAPVAGFVGRVVREKGILELAGAYRAARRAFPDLHLLIVGPLEEQDAIPQDVVDFLRQDPQVRLVGEDWDTPPLYAAMDLVVLPTYREGFPNVPLEAAAMGLPVVATRVPGCVDAVADGVTGLLVPARDPAALGEALQAYLGEPGLRHRHGAAGRDRVLREFRQEVLWAGLHAEYRRLLESRCTGRSGSASWT
jgi:glycosyltransferase involved in cell wall biosynthesis